MSARTIESLHPATWASIQMHGQAIKKGMVWNCGCSQQKDGKVWLCTYHSGFDDGAWVVTDKEDPDE